MKIEFGIMDEIKRGMQEVLLDGAERIADESQSQVPISSGELRENCKVTLDGELSVTIGYDLPYAVIQHENLAIKHDGGKAKFLENPFEMECGNIVAAAAEKIKRVIG